MSDPSTRSAFLDQACKNDPDLRSRIELLLAAQSPADEFFSVRPCDALVCGESKDTGTTGSVKSLSPDLAATLEEPPKTRIGRYQLIERLGEGGCGVVYLAEQQEPVRRRVALKIIRLGMDTESVIARFEAERQALALMDHPNIARVLDAGATESGRPYFVMELVRGVKITEFCNENQFDTEKRLRLFILVCHAIQHAHQKGIIHRDIKPSNILVTLHDGVPVPKMIDFGIAKATEGRLADNTVFTACDQFIGTPSYMSPEQAEMGRLDVDTRSDIYSLGVLLYELLTGCTLFDTKQLMESGLNEMRRSLREKEPRMPSTMLATLGNKELSTLAAQHRTEPPRLISALRGDLDWIVMKALEKDRRRRYQTANGLAMDVERHLNSEPVIARPPSRLYRFQKLVRRNKGAFVAIGAITVTLILGLGASTVLLLKEREARRRAVESEQKQIRLREEAETRQKLSQAIIYLSREKYPDADALVDEVAVPERDLEYPTLFRGLGDWHASHGRWREAADRFAVVMQVVQSDDSATATMDCLRYGPALIEAGDVAGYERFREKAIAQYTGTTDPIAAERVVKISLLRPADARLLARLQPLGKVAAASLKGNNSRNDEVAAWLSFSLALWEFRRANYERSLIWCKRSVEYDNSCPSRESSVQLVVLMANQALGQTGQTLAALSECRKVIENRFARGLLVFNSKDGFWFDWVFARILLREAEARVGQTNLKPSLDASTNQSEP